MTVAELIEILKGMPQDAPVTVADYEPLRDEEIYEELRDCAVVLTNHSARYRRTTLQSPTLVAYVACAHVRIG